MSYRKAITGFSSYVRRVLKTVQQQEPKAKFSVRELAVCYGHNIPSGIAAAAIIDSHREKRERRRKSNATRTIKTAA